jgi:secreted trypsin-like serine protease
VRKITIRDDTAFRESIEVRRFWQFPMFNGTSYYDIAIIELERRILYDWETYGDSPTCLAKNYNIHGTKGLVQGYGLTEDGIFPESLLEVNVTIITNEQCQRKLQWKMKNTNMRDSDRQIFENDLPDGLNKHLLCTQGIYNFEKKIYSGPCKGDDGGPLYINGKVNSEGDIEGQTLAAINSGAAGKCGKGDYPAWWTRISSYFQWITCIEENAQKDLSHTLVQRKCQFLVPKVFEEQLPLTF